MEIRVLRYFLTVVRENGINRAAEVLHITQPTLSRQLAQLEAELGVSLFQRGARRISLTNEGILLRRRAAAMCKTRCSTGWGTAIMKVRCSSPAISAPTARSWCSRGLRIRWWLRVHCRFGTERKLLFALSPRN